MDYRGLKNNHHGSRKTISPLSGDNIAKQINDIYQKADMLFGNVDYTNLNYETAKLLDRTEGIDYGKRTGAGTGGKISPIVGYPRLCESENGRYEGTVMEAACGKERRIYGWLKLSETARTGTDSFYFPHEFSETPIVIFDTIGLACSTDYDVWDRIVNENNDGPHPKKFEIDQYDKEGFRIIYQAGTTTERKELIFVAMGLGDFEVEEYYERPDFNLGE